MQTQRKTKTPHRPCPPLLRRCDHSEKLVHKLLAFPHIHDAPGPERASFQCQRQQRNHVCGHIIYSTKMGLYYTHHAANWFLHSSVIIHSGRLQSLSWKAAQGMLSQLGSGAAPAQTGLSHAPGPNYAPIPLGLNLVLPQPAPALGRHYFEHYVFYSINTFLARVMC